MGLGWDVSRGDACRYHAKEVRPKIDFTCHQSLRPETELFLIGRMSVNWRSRA